MFDHNFENLNKHDLYIKSKQVSSPKEKIKCLERITEIDPDDAYAWHQLGNLFASFNEIKSKHCWNISIQKYKGRIEMFKDDAQKFQKDPSHLHQMDIESSDVIYEIGKRFFCLGQVYENLKQYSLAVNAFKKAFEIKPTATNCLYYIGKSLYSDEKYEESEKYLLQFAKKHESYQVHFLLGSIYWKTDYVDDALTEFWKCIETAGNDSESDYYRYMSYYNLRNLKKAEQYLEKSIEKDPNDLTMIYELITHYEENNEPKKAYRYYEMVKSKRDEFP